MRLHPLLVAVVLLIAGARSALADPLLITGGSVSLGSIASGYAPPFGITLTGRQTGIAGITYNQTLSFVNTGDVVDMSALVSLSTTANSGPFDQEVNGVQLSDVLLRGTLRFTASPVTFTGDLSRDLQAPFTMDGVVSFFRNNPNFDQELLLTAFVKGSGTASASLSMEPTSDFFRVFAVTYAFEPAAPAAVTPEPGTLLLLGTGLIVALQNAQRRKQ